MPSSLARALLAILVLTLSIALPSLADEAGGGDAASSGEATQAKKQEKKDDGPPPIEKVVEEMERIDGVLPLYRKEDKLVAVIPKDQQDKPMLLATSIAGGGFFTGWQWSDFMLRFERHGDKVLVRRPETNYVTRSKGPISDAVERTHPGWIVASLPVLGEGKRGEVAVSLSDLYVNQAAAFVGSLAEGRDPGLSRLRTVKNFPENAEVSVELVERPKGADHGDILTVHYSLSSLPENGYVPRLADDRVGYFLTVARDYTKDYLDDTTFVRFVNRWNLEKADPSLDLSPPKEPIVFYVEKTVPTRYRRWVQEGIAEWNRAFEKIGFVGAIEVRQQTDTQFADIDPEDVRYNFFRWITSDSAFAMGPSRVDPRTGQILDADIIFDDSMLRWNLQSWDLMIEDAVAESQTAEDRAFLDANPSWDPMRFLRGSGRQEREDAWQRLREIAESRPNLPTHEPLGSGRTACSIGRGRVQELGLASIQLGLVGAVTGDDSDGDDSKGDEKAERQWPEEFVGQVIKETVMHEVGHTLGLRHNFKASSWRPMEDVNPAEGEDTVPDTAASVMDYNPLNIAPEGRKQGNWQMTTIGPYDAWAIEYGYSQTGAKSPEKELKEIREIASRGAESGHDYATDEDVGIGDPLVNRWDFGADPMVYATERIEIVRNLQRELIDRVVEEGDSYASARQGMDVLLNTHGRAATYAAGFVGGTYFHRDHRDDPGARDPIVVVPAETQRRALKLVSDNVFAKDAFEVPSELLAKLPPSRWSHWGNPGVWGASASYPFHDRVLTLQSWNLYQLLSPTSLRRVMDNEMVTPADEDALTLPELFGELTGAIFEEIDAGPSGTPTNRQPFLPSVRRNLQREYVAHLIDLSLRPDGGYFPRAARTQAWSELRELDGKLGSLLEQHGGSLDDYSRAHLEESQERIARALDASFRLGG